MLMFLGGLLAVDSFLPKSKGTATVLPELLLGLTLLSIGWGIKLLALRAKRASEPSSRAGTMDRIPR